MAQRIGGAGFSLAIWARRAVSLAPFDGTGAVIVDSLEELGARSEFVGVCVTDDRAAQQVILAEEGGVLAGMKTGGAIAVHATVHPTTCIELAERAAERGIALLDAPVSGGGQRALVGKLTVMVGGARADFERFRSVFDSYGDPVRYLGEVGNGQRCKLVNNLLFSANLQIAADIAKLGDALGLEAEASFAAGKMDPDEDDVVIVGWGAEVEYRLLGTPVVGFAGFVGYTGAYYNQDDDDDELFEHRIAFGVRIYFGQESLEANDRNGASLDLPRYLEWNGQIAGALE